MSVLTDLMDATKILLSRDCVIMLHPDDEGPDHYTINGRTIPVLRSIYVDPGKAYVIKGETATRLIAAHAKDER